jgi:DNA-binding CsgD family transcriptional regulator
VKQIAHLRADRAIQEGFESSPSLKIPQEEWSVLRDCDRQVLALNLFGLSNDEIAQRVNLKNSVVASSSILRASKALGIDKAKRDEMRSGIERLSNPKLISGYRDINERDRLIGYFYNKASPLASNSEIFSFSPAYIEKLIKKFLRKLVPIDQKILKLELKQKLKHSEIAPLVQLDKSRVFSRSVAFKKQVREYIDSYLNLKSWLPRQLDPEMAALLGKRDIAILRSFLKDDDIGIMAQDHSIKEKRVHELLAKIAKKLGLNREEFYEIKEHNLNKRDFQYLYRNLLIFLFPPQGTILEKLKDLGKIFDPQSLFNSVVGEIKNFNPRTNKRYFKLMLQGYSQGAISRKLDISQSSISVSLGRTRLRLLTFLEDKLKNEAQKA